MNDIIILTVVAIWLFVTFKIGRIIIKHEAESLAAHPNVKRRHVYLLAGWWPLAIAIMFASVLNDALEECWEDDE